MKRFFCAWLAVLLLLSLCTGCTEPAPTTTGEVPPSTTTVPPATNPRVDYTNATVILYTANIRGDLQVYSQIATVRAHYESLGATVLLVDAGNYLQGSAYTGTDMGLAVYYLMDAVGYDVAGMGLYDFAYGKATAGYAAHGDLTHYYTQAELYRGTEAMTYQRNEPWSDQPLYVTRSPKPAATFQVVCSNLRMEAEAGGCYAFASSCVLGEALRVGFQSILPQEAQNGILEDYLQGYSPCEVDKPDCDILVSMGEGEGDIVLDIPADGTLATGAYVVDHTTKAITFEEVTLSRTNEAVDAWIADLPLKPVVGTLDADLNGSRRENCNGQTALGTLVADALKWYAESKLGVAEYPVVGLFNGGNCTGFLYSGEVTELDIRAAIHGSKAGVGLVYLTGAQLLEVLEAATQRENCPGWAQVSGVAYTVDTSKAYDFGAAYGAYYQANSVNRVTVTTEGFDPSATYAVVADMLLLTGAETYYLLAKQEIAMKDPSGADICQILIQYIQEALGGHIGG